MADTTAPAEPAQRGEGGNRGRGGRGRGRGGRGRGGSRPPRQDKPVEHGTPADAAAQPPQYQPRALFVAGFVPGTEAQEVGTLFSQFGDVEHVRLSARGVGRVVFVNEDSVEKSLGLNTTEYKGVKLRVEKHRRSQYARVRRNNKPRAPRAEGANGEAAADGAPREPRKRNAPKADGAPRPPREPRAPKTEGAPRPPREPRAPRAPRAAPAHDQANAAPVELKPLDPTRVFLGRLPYSLEDAELNEIFGPLGASPVERSRNHLFALVQFATAEQAAKAVEQKPTLKSGRAIRVEAENPNIRATRAANRPAGRPRVRRPRKPVDPALLDKKRVFIGYLPEGVTQEQVKSHFQGVSSVELRGKYGYVNFESEQASAAALSSNDTTAFGGEQKIKVEVATRLPRPVKSETEA